MENAREHLELSSKSCQSLKMNAKNIMLNSCLRIHEPSLRMLIKINVDILKIASFDLEVHL